VIASDAPLPQLTLAESEARVAVAWAGIQAVAADVDACVRANARPGHDLVVRASIASTFAVESTITVVSHLFRAAGASAIFTGSVLERSLRDLFTLGGHRLVQRENYLVHGGSLFGVTADSRGG
jgi:alkylation response protein AidB-like acyl-CoA dehydrogenase